MKRLPPFAPLLLVLLSLAAAHGKTPPPAAKPLTISLPAGATAKPIGVEPEGGRFLKILEANAQPNVPREAAFDTDSRQQNTGTLAIYASEADTIHEDKPLMRLEISGLGEGPEKHRVRIKLTPVSSGAVTVEAWDLHTRHALAIRKLRKDEVEATLFATTSRSGKPAAPDRTLPGIGSLDTHAATQPPRAPAGRLEETIGVRSAGGLLQTLLPAGAKPKDTKEFYLRPRFPDQTTMDITLFAGNSPYIENDRIWKHYLISGIPVGDAKRRVKLVLTVGPDGKAREPDATVSGQPVKIQKYSEFAAQRLSETPKTQPPAIASRIPAAPAR